MPNHHFGNQTIIWSFQLTYKPCVRKLPATNHTLRKWTWEASESLKDYFECTEMNVLLESQENSRDMDIDRMAVLLILLFLLGHCQQGLYAVFLTINLGSLTTLIRIRIRKSFIAKCLLCLLRVFIAKHTRNLSVLGASSTESTNRQQCKQRQHIIKVIMNTNNEENRQ